MAAAAVGRGAQTMNSIYVKSILRKAYHKKSPDTASDVVKLNGEEMKAKSCDGSRDGNWWIRDYRTGIYYPKGEEKIMEDVPLRAGKDFGINWFSNREDCL